MKKLMNTYKKFFTVLLMTFSLTTLSAAKLQTINQHSVNERTNGELSPVLLEKKFLPDTPGIAGNRSEFGYSISVEGNTAIIGAPGASDSGAVYIYEFDGSNWNQKQILRSDNLFNYQFFGKSVSLFGQRLLVGATQHFLERDANAVHVFELINDKWVLQDKLTASDGELADRFATSVSLYGDRALVGALGKAYIFDLINGQWQETQILQADDGTINNGPLVQVSLYEDRAVIGAPFDADNGNEAGAVYVFELQNNVWQQTQKIKPNDGDHRDFFGNSVNLNNNRMIIGARDDEDGDNNGSAYVFEYSQGQWLQTYKFLPDSNQSADDFGFSVDQNENRVMISAIDDGYLGAVSIYELVDGSWTQTTHIDQGVRDNYYGYAIALSGEHAFIGAFADEFIYTNDSAVYIHNLDNGLWQSSAQLSTEDSSAFDNFGQAVNYIGDMIMITSPYDDDNNINKGAVYIYELIKGAWAQTDKLFSDNLLNEHSFGKAISYSENRMLVAADTFSLPGSGLVYVFDLIDGAWQQSATLVHSDAASGDQFGRNISLLGNRAAVGAFRQDGVEEDSGAVYIFDLIDGQWTETAKLVADDGQQSDAFGIGLHLSVDRIIIGASGDNDNGDASGSSYIFDLVNDEWQQTVKLTPNDAESFDFFGLSVQLLDDMAIISARGDDDIHQDSGAVYIYKLVHDMWVQSDKLAPESLIPDAKFGLGITSENNRIAIWTADGNEDRTGAVFVYDLVDDNWQLAHKISAKDTIYFDNFGNSMSMFNDKILIGSVSDDVYGTDSGSAYLFDLNPPDEIFVNGFEF